MIRMTQKTKGVLGLIMMFFGFLLFFVSISAIINGNCTNSVHNPETDFDTDEDEK